MDLLGKGKNKEKKGLFADIVERRQNEGNFHGMWRAVTRTGPTSWMGSNLMLVKMIVAAGVVFAMMFSLWPRHKEPRPGVPNGPYKVSSAERKPTFGGPKMGAVTPADEKGSAGTGDQPVKPEPKETGTPEPKEPAKPEASTPKANSDDFATRQTEREKGHFVFRPMSPQYTPLRELDTKFLEERVWDDPKQPAESADILNEPDLVSHIFRYLRTHGPDLALQASPKLNHDEMLRNPTGNRGKVVSMRVIVVKKYMNFGWPKSESGVLDTTMLFCYGLGKGNQGIYVVLVPQPAEDFQEEEVYNLTGVFYKRYPYQLSSGEHRDAYGRTFKPGDWQLQPLVLTAQMTPAPPATGVSRNFTIGIIVVAAVLIICMLFLVRGETRESLEKRRERIERRKRVGMPIKPPAKPAQPAQSAPPAPPAPPAQGDQGLPVLPPAPPPENKPENPPAPPPAS